MGSHTEFIQVILICLTISFTEVWKNGGGETTKAEIPPPTGGNYEKKKKKKKSFMGQAENENMGKKVK